MKKFLKKTIVFAIAAIMMLAMAIPAMAAIPATENAPDGDKAPISVSGLNAGDKVTFYQVMKVTYNSDKQVLDDSQWEIATGVSDALAAKLRKGEAATEADINALAAGIRGGSIGAPASEEIPAVNGVATLPDMRAGTYIAIVTTTSKVPAVVYTYNDKGEITKTEYVKKDWSKTETAPTDATKDQYRYVTPVYNPIMLSAGYNDQGTFATAGKDIAVGSKYGNTGTAKSSTPTVAKEITGGVTPDASDESDKTDEYDEDEFTTDKDLGKKTASLGDTINYEVQVNVPQYPDGAVNKSLWMTDTFDTGITFSGVETIDIDGYKVPVDAQGKADDSKKVSDYYPLVKGDSTLGWVKKTSNKTLGNKNTKDAIEIIFDYDVAKTLASPLHVKYDGVLNADAEIGHKPNKNKVEYFYTTNPNKGGTYKPGDNKPEKDIAKEEDEEVVYTYKIALIKTDTSGVRLDGAVFVLKDSNNKYYSAEKKFDKTPSADDLSSEAKAVAAGLYIVKSQNGGLAEVDGLFEMGTYTFEEIVAPDGFTLPATHPTVPVTANWVNCQKAKTEKEWTTEIEKAKDYDATKDPKATQDGWILNSRHLTEAEYQALDDKTDALPAYVRFENTYFYNVENPTQTTAAGYHFDTLMNSKTPELPSTGGMGTYIFTIIGVAVVAIAAGMLIFRKKQA